jgi:syntaxin 1B/2/3
MLKLEKGITEVHEMFLDLSTMVHMQGEQVDRIDLAVEESAQRVEEGREQLRQARNKQKSARRKKFILAGIVAGISLVLLLCLVFALL